MLVNVCGLTAWGALVAEYRLLGPVEICADGRLIDAGPPRQRAVLAALLVDAGRVVAWDALVRRVWGERSPLNVRATMRAHVTRIRRVLERARVADGEPVRLLHRPGGYLLDLDADRVDLHRFRQLHARRVSSAAEQVEVLHQALELWRGQPLTGVVSDWAARMRDSWSSERLAAVLTWAKAELTVGRPDDVIGPLTELSSEFPLVESIVVVLMQALCAAARGSDALAEYGRIRQQLANQLGTDPGPELQELHLAILQGRVAPS